MKKKLSLIIVALIVILAVNAETLDRIVAKVGREVILESELENRYEQFITYNESAAEISKEDVLNSMIENKLLLITARNNELEVDEYALDNEIERRLEQLKSQFASDAEFRAAIKSETGFTLNEYKDFLKNQYQEQKLRDMIISDQIISKIKIVDAEIEEFYNEILEDIPVKPESNRIGMILLNLEASEDTKQRIKKELLAIKDRIVKGEDFAELAKQYSNCGSSEDGGYLGFIKRGDTVKPFEETAYKLEPGEISDIILTQYGYHIIYMHDKKDDQLELSHILLNVNASKEDIQKVRDTAQSILQQLDNGADFGKLAKEYSQEDSSAAQGGVIGDFTKDEYPELFKEYIDKLDYGQHTNAIEESGSIYIFSLLEVVPERKYTYSEMKDEIRNEIFLQKQDELYNELIEDLKKKIYIEIFF